MNVSRIFLTTLILAIALFAQGQQKYVIVIHGGAGVMSQEKMTPGEQTEYKTKLNEALELGDKMLKEGAEAVDVVVRVINILEDSPLFNAGKGAVFTNDEKVELDASIMDGKTLNAGAVAGVQDIKNPINAAREVMQHSDHVFLSGKGASDFARKQGLEMVQNKYFYTDSRYESLMQLKKQEHERTQKDNTGTVGCAVLDTHGNICAGTSTGGMTNKKYGRIGDSPIIGAGTYANNESCAVSGTGQGEFFMRLLVAYDVHALVTYSGRSIAQAADEVVHQKLGKLGGKGGLIAIDKTGNVAMPFNTDGMYRGFITSGKDSMTIKIFADE